MPRRIAMISEHASPLTAAGGIDAGGQNIYVAQLASHLTRLGHEVDIFTRRDSEDAPEVVEWRDRMRVVHVPAGPASFVAKEDMLPYMPEFTDFISANWVRLGGYDLIHANFWMSGMVAAALKRKKHVPFVITFHALGKVRSLHRSAPDRFEEERTAIEMDLARTADRIIAECPQDEHDLIEHYAATPANISVVPCGVDLCEFTPTDKHQARVAMGIDDDHVIVQVGRLVPRKGIETLVRAVGILRREHRLEPRLLIVGGESEEPDAEKTPEIGRLLQIAACEDVCDLVTFVGQRARDQLSRYYAAADVFVTTPWYEPFGMTPLEAMACARPVIGTDVGGLKYSIVHGVTGYLVPPNAPESLARSLVSVLGNPELAAEMGRHGHERVTNSFTWDSVAAAISDIYESVLAQATNGASEGAAVQVCFSDAIEVMARSRDEIGPQIVAAAHAIDDAFGRKGKLLICGNGGSAADAQHFAGELVGRFVLPDRPALPAIALTADSTILTAWANDASFEEVFARQVCALAARGDVLVGISTSGQSPNVLRAVECAREAGVRTIALTGKGGGRLADLCDIAIVVPSDDTQHIQEVHGVAIHVICDLVEKRMVATDGAAKPMLAAVSDPGARGGHAA